MAGGGNTELQTQEVWAGHRVKEFQDGKDLQDQVVAHPSPLQTRKLHPLGAVQVGGPFPASLSSVWAALQANRYFWPWEAPFVD